MKYYCDDLLSILQPEGDGPDLSYFAPDCFHLSLKGHRAAADALWDNMIEPVGKKRTKWSPGETVECPTSVSEMNSDICLQTIQSLDRFRGCSE